MLISTSAHLLNDMLGFDYIASLERHARAGFRVFDFGFLDFVDPSSPFAQDDWRSWVERVGEYAQKNGLTFMQSHAPIYSFLTPGVETERYNELTRRSLEASGMLGIPWCVIHTSTPYSGDRNEALRVNREFFEPMLELAHRWNTGICVENLFPKKCVQYVHDDNIAFAHQPEDLIELVDGIGDDRMGICLDTGHSMCSGIQPSLLAKAFGKRIKVLHIQDSDGSWDQHLGIGYGKVDWKAFMLALKEAGYEGTFSYEAHNAVQKVNEPFKDIAMRTMYLSAEHLIDLYWK